METVEFHEKDDCGLNVEKSHYFSVKLTSEQMQLVGHKRMEFYNIEGKTLFELKDGKNSGEFMFFVIFR